MRFLIDMPLPLGMVHWLTDQGHDVVHALELGLDRSTDEEILERARHEERIVITADLDYPRLLATTPGNGPGLILFREGDYSWQEVIERMTQVLQTIPSDELPHSIVVVEKWRIRRRRLSG
ncbi:MAG: hypothetical protein GH143_01350 [Calditrichaeota bacterium]|nr:hypothetical protein [Calditrichota bacterium]